jgi:hypothetical protein
VTCGTGHNAADLRALAACARTFLTMIVVMLRALFSARVADLGAYVTNAFREVGAASHLTCRQQANVGAAPIELDAASHHFHIVFVQACGRAVFAGDGAFLARGDTVVVIVV